MKSYRFLIVLSFLLILLGGIIGFSSNVHQTISQERSQIDYKQREARAPAEVKKRLLELREQIKARKLTFEVGYTTAMDESLEKLAGTKAPPDLPAQAGRQY